MLVEIDVDQLVIDAATMQMDETYPFGEWKQIVEALQKQLHSKGVYVPIHIQVRQQVKEYKKLTMWRD